MFSLHGQSAKVREVDERVFIVILIVANAGLGLLSPHNILGRLHLLCLFFSWFVVLFYMKVIRKFERS